ncbi:UNVERIFIED_CONTAM: hypothetical protein PYX00_008821 [Menopon gallinae]|uniref:CCHC-type domain-containing protein n=1 Tax=Menopon gallinae TaxID=328185 RepID=A0AAW2HPM4_9NEOP
MECRIREKVEPEFCSKCQNYGHARSSCKNAPAGGIRCLKCGKIGHIAKDCGEKLNCFNCNSPEHRGDSTKCPKYARYLEEALKKAARPKRN